jgi:predicted NUDIX family NTP pyrophosphohydrolase
MQAIAAPRPQGLVVSNGIDRGIILPQRGRARMKILKGQARFIDRLLEALDQIEES